MIASPFTESPEPVGSSASSSYIHVGGGDARTQVGARGDVAPSS